MIVFFSSASGYTKRFVEKVGLPAVQIPLRPRVEGMITIDRPRVLILPTYGAGPATKAVPKQVIQFLNIEQNRNNVEGVIGTGNTNFHDAYCLAADIVSYKLQKPLLYRLEIVGTQEDVDNVREGVPKFLFNRGVLSEEEYEKWKTQSMT